MTQTFKSICRDAENICKAQNVCRCYVSRNNDTNGDVPEYAQNIQFIETIEYMNVNG